MLNNGRDFSVISLYFKGESVESCPLDFVPRIGETLEFWHEVVEGDWTRRELKTRGKVERVEHIIEKSGQSPADFRWVQHIHVFLVEA